MSLPAAVAQRRLSQYLSHFGARQYEFATAAALPVVLGPRLVHLLRINLFLDGEPLDETAELDLLISPLCNDLGTGLYEMDPTIRELLLKRLCSEPEERARDVASLLWHYTDHRPRPWADQPGLERAQQLSALQFLDPAECARWLAEADTAAQGNDQRSWYVAMRSKLEPGNAALARRDQLAELRAHGQRLMHRCRRAIVFNNRMWRAVEELELSIVARATLERANIKYVGELVQKAESEMSRMGLDRRTVTEIQAQLAKLGLEFGMVLESWPKHNTTDALMRVLASLESGLAYVDEVSFERTKAEFEEAIAVLLVSTAPLVGFAEQVRAADTAGWRRDPDCHLAIVGRDGFGHEWLACHLLDGTDTRLTLAYGRDAVHDANVTYLPDLSTFTEAQVRGWFARHQLLFDEGDVLNLDVVNRITTRLWDSTPDLFFDAVCEAANVSRSVIDRHRRRHFERVLDVRGSSREDIEHADVLVLCASTELLGAFANDGLHLVRVHARGVAYDYYRGKALGGSSVVFTIPGSARAQVTVAIATVIELFDPKLVISAGISVGVPDRGVESGDVVVVERIVDFTVGRAQHSAYTPSPRIMSHLRGFPIETPRVHFGGLVSITGVLDVEAIRRIDRTALTVDVDGGALSEAAAAVGMELIAIRGIVHSRTVAELPEAATAVARYVVKVLESLPNTELERLSTSGPYDGGFVGRVLREGAPAGVAYLVRPNLAVTAGRFKFEERYIVQIPSEGVDCTGEVIVVEGNGEIVFLRLDPPVDSSVLIPPLAGALIMSAPAAVLGSRGEVTDCIFASPDTIHLQRPNKLSVPYNGAPIVRSNLVLAHVVHVSERTAHFRPAFLVSRLTHGAARLADAIRLLREAGPVEEVRISIAELELDAIDVRRLWASSNAERRWVALVAIGAGRLIDCDDIIREALTRGSEEEREEATSALEALPPTPERTLLKSPLDGKLARSRPVQLTDFATRYLSLRTQPAGSARTAEMERLVTSITRELGPMTTTEEVEALFRGDEGRRIVALALLLSHTMRPPIEVIAEAIEQPRSAFEQWLGLRVVASIIDEVSHAHADRLRTAVERRRRTTPDQDRDKLAASLLERLALSAQETLESVLATALERIRQVTRSGYDQIVLLSDSGEFTVVAAAVPVEPYRIESKLGIVGAALGGAVVDVPNVEEDPRYIESYAPTRSELAVPIVRFGTVIGVINSESVQRRHFTPAHVIELEAIAAELADRIPSPPPDPLPPLVRIAVKALAGAVPVVTPEARPSDTQLAAVGAVIRAGSVIGVVYRVDTDLVATAGSAVSLDEQVEVRLGEIVHNAEVVLIQGGGQLALLRIQPRIDHPLPWSLAGMLIAAPGVRVSVLGSGGVVVSGALEQGSTIELLQQNELPRPLEGAPVVQGDFIIAHVVRVIGRSAAITPAFHIHSHLLAARRWCRALDLADIAAAFSIATPEPQLKTSRALLDDLHLQQHEVWRMWGSQYPGRRWIALATIADKRLPGCEHILREAFQAGNELERREAERVLESFGIRRDIVAQPSSRIADAEFAAELREARELEAPWHAVFVAARQVQNTPLRDLLITAAEQGAEGNLEWVAVATAGLADALRIHFTRSYRIARGSDAPRYEPLLPAMLSVPASNLFPGVKDLHLEPVLAEDKYGEAAVARLGFSVEELAIFDRATRFVLHMANAPGRDVEAPEVSPSAETLVLGLQALAAKLTNLEQTEPTLVRSLAELVQTHWKEGLAPGMTRPKPLRELIDVLGRCDDLFNVIDLAVLAHRNGAAFSVLSVRLTVGRVAVRPKPKALIRPDWFVIRQFRNIADFYPLIDRIVAGAGMDRLFKNQPGPLLFSRPPQGWFSNGMNPRPTLFGPNGTSYQIGASWGPLFSTPEEFLTWQNDVNASDDVHDVDSLVQEYGFRQPFSAGNHHCQLHIEAEFPLYFSTAQSNESKTRLEFNAPECDVSSWRIKWRSGTRNGTSALERTSDKTVAATIEGSHSELQVTPVLSNYALPEFRPRFTAKDSGGELEKPAATITTDASAKASPSVGADDHKANHGQAAVRTARSSSLYRNRIDFGILTIREDENTAVLRRFDSLAIEKQRHRYRIRSLALPGGDAYTLAVLRCLEQGNANAQAAAHDLLEDLAPRFVLVVGIAGCVPSHELTLGDVVISSRIADFSVEAVIRGAEREYALSGGPLHPSAATLAADVGAMIADGELKNWNTPDAIGRERPPVDLAEDRFYGDDEWRKDVRKKLGRHFDERTSRAPLAVTGAIASSDRLIKDDETLAVWLKIQRQVVAVEMESAGIYKATQRAHVPFLAIRGISDVIGFKRDPDWTSYACETAASFAQAFLLTRPIEPIARP